MHACIYSVNELTLLHLHILYHLHVAKYGDVVALCKLFKIYMYMYMYIENGRGESPFSFVDDYCSCCCCRGDTLKQYMYMYY